LIFRFVGVVFRLVQFTPIRPIRLDEDLAVFRGASQSLLNLLPPMPPDVAAERSRGWLQRKFKCLSARIIAERDYTEPLRGFTKCLEHRMKIEIVHCPT
jgi:hypothetical protein